MIRFRRMLGLFAFFYAMLHFLTYLVGDRFASLDFPDGFVAWSTLVNLMASIWEDVAKRPYITVGFIAFVSMIPLALTSTAGWIRRLGGRNWQRLHRLIYLTGIAGVTHYWWKVKADTLHPIIYAAHRGAAARLSSGALVQAIAMAAPARSSRRLRTNMPTTESQLEPSGQSRPTRCASASRRFASRTSCAASGIATRRSGRTPTRIAGSAG